MDYRYFHTEDGFICIEQQGVRCFLFEGDGKALLIDTGFGGPLAELCRELTELPVQLVLTHGDRDHTGAAESFKKPLIHPAELPHFFDAVTEPVDTETVEEGDVIDIGGWKFEIIHIPGHTPGSIALLERNRGFLIGGDSVQAGGPVYMFGPHRSMEMYRQSLIKLNGYKDRFDRIYASHNRLVVPPDTISALIAYSGELLSGIIPPPEPAPERLPDYVRRYSKGELSFYLDSREYSNISTVDK